MKYTGLVKGFTKKLENMTKGRATATAIPGATDVLGDSIPSIFDQRKM